MRLISSRLSSYLSTYIDWTDCEQRETVGDKTGEQLCAGNDNFGTGTGQTGHTGTLGTAGTGGPVAEGGQLACFVTFAFYLPHNERKKWLRAWLLPTILYDKPSRPMRAWAVFSHSACIFFRFSRSVMSDMSLSCLLCSPIALFSYNFLILCSVFLP